MTTHLCRAVRLVQLIDLLRDRCYTTDELAERFGVSQRTIQKDLYDLTGDPLYVPLVDRHVWQHAELCCARAEPAS